MELTEKELKILQQIVEKTTWPGDLLEDGLNLKNKIKEGLNAKTKKASKISPKEDL